MVDNDINWVSDPWGRKGEPRDITGPKLRPYCANIAKEQYFRQFAALESQASVLFTKFNTHRQEIVTLESKYDSDITTSQNKAYTALQDVVNKLLVIKEGNTRLSREDSPLVAALNHSAQSLSVFCDQARDHMRATGVSAGYFMSEGNGADVLVRALRQHHRALHSERTAVASQCKRNRIEYLELKGREWSLRDRVNSARSNQDDMGNAFLGFFDGDTRDRLARDVQNAEQRLDANSHQQGTKNDEYEILYKLASAAQLAGAAAISLTAKITKISNNFDTTFNDVTESQEKAAEFWKGLLKLKAQIHNTDYKCTRDSSLRIILQLLTEDDHLFRAGSFAAEIESNIRSRVESVLGNDAWVKLRAPAIDTDSGVLDL